MKRKAFILTEILTGMILQVGFAVVLCSAFYMILNFSTNAQQGFAANDKGQMVISYFDSRIRNAGLGLWGCPSSKDILVALQNIPALKDSTINQKNLCLPVAVLNNTSGTETVSRDNTGRFYRGNVLTLLYAHKDTHEVNNKPVKLILLTDSSQSPIKLDNNFDLIDKRKNGLSSYSNSRFANNDGAKKNILNYAVMENAGVPVHIYTVADNQIYLQCFTTDPPAIYSMSELLNLECQKLYVRKDANGYNFVFQELDKNGNWGEGDYYYHTKDILDLYMTLDTKPSTADKIPIFELRVLVSEGLNEQGTTDKPKDWPGRWKGTDFNTHKVHVSKATWKLYNLAPFFTN